MIATREGLIQQLFRTVAAIVCASLVTVVVSVWYLSVFPDGRGHFKNPAISMNAYRQEFQLNGCPFGIQFIHESHGNPTEFSVKLARFTTLGDANRLSNGYPYGNVTTFMGFCIARLAADHRESDYLVAAYTAVTFPYWFAISLPFLAYLYFSRLLILRLALFTSRFLYQWIRAGKANKVT